jgi:hypothetical protein
MFPLIKDKAWEEFTQQVVTVVALICSANIGVSWMQFGSIVGWAIVLTLI